MDEKSESKLWKPVIIVNALNHISWIKLVIHCITPKKIQFQRRPRTPSISSSEEEEQEHISENEEDDHLIDSSNGQIITRKGSAPTAISAGKVIGTSKW